MDVAPIFQLQIDVNNLTKETHPHLAELLEQHNQIMRQLMVLHKRADDLMKEIEKKGGV